MDRYSGCTIFLLVVCCVTLSLADDSDDQALKAAADLSLAGIGRYGVASYGSAQYPSGPSFNQPVILPKAKSSKSWTKHIFKASSKGDTLPSYVIPPSPTGSQYTERYGNYGNGYNRQSYDYVHPSRGSSIDAPLVGGGIGGGFGIGGFGLGLIQPPLVGSSLYGTPSYPSVFNNFGPFGNLGGNFGYAGFQQSYTPTLVGAFDNYRGPIYYGGFRPTLGPYGGKPFSDLLSVTDSYGRPIFPYPSFNDLYSQQSSSY